MTDEELAQALAIPVGFVMVMSPEKRARYERLIEIAEALNRGERPAGVMVDGPRPKRRRPR